MAFSSPSTAAGHTPFLSPTSPTALKSSGDNELVVASGIRPTKAPSRAASRSASPSSIWYTPVTGIWQTVWTETVPAVSISKLKLTPDVDGEVLLIETSVAGSGDAFDVEITARGRHGNRRHPSTAGPTSPAARDRPREAVVPRFAVPVRPRLNHKKDGQVVDSVTSYFAMRKVSLGKDGAGYQRLMLNNKPLFQFGPLRPGWWPDGLYTAPTDDAMKWDIPVHARPGFNMCRKHIKLEPGALVLPR
jgi:hypothetical protein